MRPILLLSILLSAFLAGCQKYDYVDDYVGVYDCTVTQSSMPNGNATWVESVKITAGKRSNRITIKSPTIGEVIETVDSDGTFGESSSFWGYFKNGKIEISKSAGHYMGYTFNGDKK